MQALSAELARASTRVASDGFVLLVSRDHPLVIDHLGTKRTLQPGDGYLLGRKEPVFYASPFLGRISTVSIPREALAHIAHRPDDLSGTVIRSQTQALLLLLDCLDSLERCPGPLPSALEELVAAHLHDLAALALGAAGDSGAKHRGQKAVRLRAIKQDIAAMAAQRDLSLAAIAARHHISPRSLQRMFQREGSTFRKHLLEVRLNLVHRMLRDGRHGARSISELALDCGFGDMSHFNHAFRRKFHAPPTDIRRAAKSR